MDIPENKETAKYYLVDYARTGQDGLDGIESLTSEDRIFIFYTGKENTMEISFVEKIYSCRAEIIFQKDSFRCSLPACAGYIAGTDPNAEIHIISSCKEFETLNKFYADEEFNISVQDSISGSVQKKITEPTVIEEKGISGSKPEQVENPLLHEAINNLKISEISKKKIYNIIISARESYPNSKNRQYSYVWYEISHKFADGHYDKFYNAIKPYI